jgi:hypothetical protein
VLNNPLTLVDPSGFWDCSELTTEALYIPDPIWENKVSGENDPPNVTVVSAPRTVKKTCPDSPVWVENGVRSLPGGVIREGLDKIGRPELGTTNDVPCLSSGNFDKSKVPARAGAPGVPQAHGEAETAQFLAAATTQGFWNMGRNHGANGIFDFGYNEFSGDTFNVNGTIYSDTDFGNYIAGYAGENVNHLAAPLAVRVAGIYFFYHDDKPAKFIKPWPPDWDSTEQITAGEDAGLEHLEQCHPGFLEQLNGILSSGATGH